MKNLKKLLAMLMVLVMALAFAGCNESANTNDDNSAKKTTADKPAADKPVKEKEDPESDARAAAEAFVEAFVSLDADGIAECVSGEELTEMAESMNSEMNTISEEMVEMFVVGLADSMGIDISEGKAETYVEQMVDAITSNLDIEIGAAEVAKDKVVFDAVLTMPDFEGSSFEPDEEALIEIIGDVFGIDATDEEELASVTEEDLINHGEELVDAMVEWVIGAMENIDTTSESGTMTVEKIDGEWKVTELGE